MNALPAARADANAPQTGHTPLRDHVARSVRRYLHDFNGHDPDDLYEVVLREIEAPLFAEVMRHCDGNQSRAAGHQPRHPAQEAQVLRPLSIDS